MEKNVRIGLTKYINLPIMDLSTFEGHKMETVKRKDVRKNYTLHFAKTNAEIDLFWQMLEKYFTEDIFPIATRDSSKTEEYEFFSSEEYKDEIMKLYNSEITPLKIVFLQESSGEVIGFATYVMYKNDSKYSGECFILEFCITPEYRNKGVGSIFFDMLREHVSNEQAKYFALNASNENNERFWERNRFVKTRFDESGKPVYERPL